MYKLQLYYKPTKNSNLVWVQLYRVAAEKTVDKKNKDGGSDHQTTMGGSYNATWYLLVSECCTHIP